MKKGFYSKWLVFIVAICFTLNVNSQHKINQEVVTSFMEVVKNQSMNISDFLLNSNRFSAFVNTLKTTNSLSILETKGDFIVFAPDNDAFAELPSEVMNQLFKPENLDKLRSIVDYHIVLSDLNLEKELIELNGKAYLKAINSEIIEICLESEEAMFIYDANGYPIAITQKILLSNGIVYTVEGVILPQVDVKVAMN